MRLMALMLTPSSFLQLYLFHNHLSWGFRIEPVVSYVVVDLYRYHTLLNRATSIQSERPIESAERVNMAGRFWCGGHAAIVAALVASATAAYVDSRHYLNR